MRKVKRPIPAAWRSEWIGLRSPCSTPTAPTSPSGRSRCGKCSSFDENDWHPAVIAQRLRCREISETDLDAVADLLTRGFAGRSRDYWMQGLRRQATREVPNGYPRFGYMLDFNGMPVGVLLLLYTSRTSGGATTIQCNLSSWYVEPAFRNYAPLLTKIAQRHDEVTYLNISPATWTWPIIEAQGFEAYCSGLLFSFPVLSRLTPGMTVETV